MIILILSKLFFFHGEAIEFYQIPQRDSTTFYFIYRLNSHEFPVRLKSGHGIRCIGIYGEVAHKKNIMGAFLVWDTIPADSENYGFIRGLRIKRQKTYTVKTQVNTCGSLVKFKKGEKQRDLYPLSSLIPSLTDSAVKFAWYFDTTGYVAVFSNISDSAFLTIKKEYGPIKNSKRVHVNKGWNFFKLNFYGLMPGTYLIRLTTKKYKRDLHMPLLSGSGWTDKEWRCMLSTTRYIFTQGELDSLHNATASEKEHLWNIYWQRRDPTPQTTDNEAYMEFMDRFRYAYEHYRSAFGNLLSDMGIIYVTLGPPDEVEKHEFEQNSAPYVDWYYYRYNLKFRFIDRFGTGDYELSDPPRYMLDDVMESIKK